MRKQEMRMTISTLNAHPIARERVQRLLGEMRSRERWPRERPDAYQREQLDNIVRYALSNSPYYREALGPAARGEINLSEFPVLSKSTLIAEFDRIVTDPRLRLVDV